LHSTQSHFATYMEKLDSSINTSTMGSAFDTESSKQSTLFAHLLWESRQTAAKHFNQHLPIGKRPKE